MEQISLMQRWTEPKRMRSADSVPGSRRHLNVFKDVKVAVCGEGASLAVVCHAKRGLDTAARAQDAGKRCCSRARGAGGGGGGYCDLLAARSATD